ncbi:MAG: Mur ligase domain-containing protein [Bacteroidota bacterium]|nr:Mur ligase domain-containing protein [Bacteroidota bacterium]MDX5429648.1 Mur ligase domain-containing protein [Bacteroidota bacterium]MDX5468429.1 Mur ligase domain-containing protein [Bacteroidota bacterium]
MAKRIHFISIGGAVMHNMALCLHQLGNIVTGSDDEIFEPSRSRLANAGLLPDQWGWFPEKIDSGIDAVILGMHARKDNPELQKAQELNLPIYSFPEYVYEHSKNKKRIVIAGSHGKTTTTAMLMHVLMQLNYDFDYLVGSQLEGFDTMVKLSDAPLMVIEGDEYLNSALNPKPKFLFYHASMAQITGIAWDHINVFPTWENYVEQFELFLKTLPDGAPLTWYQGDASLSDIMSGPEGKRLKSLPYDTLPHKTGSEGVEVMWEGQSYPLFIFGDHNLQNMAGAMQLASELGISNADFLKAMGSFKGTARRLERISDTGKLIAYRDFAHSPSKLKATVESVRKQYPNKRLLAAFELHTFSSLQRNFLDHYQGCLKEADEAFVFYSPRVLEHKKLPMIEPEEVSEAFGGNVQVYTDPQMLGAYLNARINGNSVLLLMSSGTFEGMPLTFRVD